MKITKYIKDKKAYTTILYTGLNISLCEMLDIINYLDRKRISPDNRQLFVPHCQAKKLDNIREIFKTENKENEDYGWNYGRFLCLNIFILGKETENDDDFLRVMSKDQIDSYFYRKVTNEKEERETKTILFFLFTSILITIIIVALIFKL